MAHETNLSELIPMVLAVGAFIGAAIYKVAQMVTGKTDKKEIPDLNNLIDEAACDKRHLATEKNFCLKLESLEKVVGKDLEHMKEKVSTLFGKVDDVHRFMAKIDGAVNGRDPGEPDLADKLKRIEGKIDKWLA